MSIAPVQTKPCGAPRKTLRASVLALTCLLVFFTARAESPLAPVIISQGARVLPVLASHGMVVAQEGTAAKIGVDILRRGGNAVDAAVAVGFALAVTLPRAGNLGGGGFMLVYLAKEKTTAAIDYREAAPAGTRADIFLNGLGEADPKKSRDEGLAVGVPGTVMGLSLAHQKYGSGKFTLAELIAPAIKLAREGLFVDTELAASLARAKPVLERWPSTASIFLRTDGSLPREGSPKFSSWAWEPWAATLSGSSEMKPGAARPSVI